MSNHYWRSLRNLPKSEIRRQALYYAMYVPLCFLLLPITMPIAIIIFFFQHITEFFIELWEAVGVVFSDTVCFLKRPKNKIKDYLEQWQMLITGKLPERIIKEFQEEDS